MDEDFALALRLQEEYDRQSKAESRLDGAAVPFDRSTQRMDPLSKSRCADASDVDRLNTSMSLVDERWETLDPNPDVRALFLQFNDRFFWGKLAGVEVRWSPRMTLCAGLCCYEGHGGLCSVRLSVPLLKLRPRKDLVETLLHEMIHAYLFVTANNRDHDAHGPEFHKHMYRINNETGTNISVYHSFHDEVDHHRQHWWRCDGPCQNRKPYFGFVKRAMNRAPHPRDTWWAEHQATCGGKFTKVKEPEDYGKKKQKSSKVSSEAASKSTSPVKPKGVPDIRSMFGSAKEKTKENTTLSGAGSSDPKSSADGLKSKTAVSSAGGSISGSFGKPTWRPAEAAGNSHSSQSNSPNVSDDINLETPAFSGRGFTLGSVRTKSRSDEKASTSNSLPVLSPISPVSNTVFSSPPPEVFQGKGVTLGGASQMQNVKPDRIVRKIPGIGIITCERPTVPSVDMRNNIFPTESHEKTTESQRQPVSSVSKSYPMSPPESPMKSLKISHSENNLGKGSVKRRLEDISSDSDTENLLNQLRHKSKRRKSEPVAKMKRNSIGVGGMSKSLALDESLSGASPGSSKRIPGFKSVSSKGATPPEFVRKDPRIIEQEKDWLTKKVKGTPKGGMLISKPTKWTPNRTSSSNSDTPKANSSSGSLPRIDFSDDSDTDKNKIPLSKVPQKKPVPRDFAINRNRRAMLGSDTDDSESESELDTLKSAFRNREFSNKQNSLQSSPSVRSTRDNDYSFTKTGNAGPHTSHGSAAEVAESCPGSGSEVAAASCEQTNPLQECPVCQMKIIASFMNIHLDICLGIVQTAS